MSGYLDKLRDLIKESPIVSLVVAVVIVLVICVLIMTIMGLSLKHSEYATILPWGVKAKAENFWPFSKSEDLSPHDQMVYNKLMQEDPQNSSKLMQEYMSNKAESPILMKVLHS